MVTSQSTNPGGTQCRTNLELPNANSLLAPPKADAIDDRLRRPHRDAGPRRSTPSGLQPNVGVQFELLEGGIDGGRLATLPSNVIDLLTGGAR